MGVGASSAHLSRKAENYAGVPGEEGKDVRPASCGRPGATAVGGARLPGRGSAAGPWSSTRKALRSPEPAASNRLGLVENAKGRAPDPGRCQERHPAVQGHLSPVPRTRRTGAVSLSLRSPLGSRAVGPGCPGASRRPLRGAPYAGSKPPQPGRSACCWGRGCQAGVQPPHLAFPFVRPTPSALLGS